MGYERNNWQAREDASLLMRVEELKRDSKRMTEAKEVLAEINSNSASALRRSKKVVGKNMNPATIGKL